MDEGKNRDLAYFCPVEYPSQKNVEHEIANVEQDLLAGKIGRAARHIVNLGSLSQGDCEIRLHGGFL